ncbi:MAG: GAF domain-containing protein [Anaerolineaceae bacterium]|nr:GAF domain-containing protein [Anaerolineaceae bacterium]
MTDIPDQRLDLYASVLEDYLNGGGEISLDQAYEIGRASIEERLSILEMTNLHQQALEIILNRLPRKDSSLRRIKMASVFLDEVLAPYEMTQRGYRETVNQLKHLNETLEERVQQRTAELQAEIIERKRGEETIQRQLADLEAMAEVSTALRVTQTLDEMLAKLIDTVLAVIHVDGGQVWLYDTSTDELYVMVSRGTELPPRLKRDNFYAGHLFNTREVFISHELATDQAIPENLRAGFSPGYGGASAPILAGDEFIGILSVDTRLPRQITLDDARFLHTVTEMAGNAIKRMLLHEQTEQRLQRITALRRIDMAITSSLDLNLTLDTLLVQVTDQLGVDAAAILLLAANELKFAAGRGFHLHGIQKSRLSIHESPMSQVVLEQRVVHIPDLHQEAARIARLTFLSGESFNAYYAVPLLAKGQVNGVLEVFHRSALHPDPEWINFLEALAGQAAIAVDNATLFNDLQRSNLELTLAYDATIEGWSKALDLRDKETEGHTQRVTELTLRLARMMGISEPAMVHIRRGALLHDIGKMGIPDAILLKQGPLTEDEWVIMHKHPTYAFEMLYPIQYLRPALDIPYCHHEWWNGNGYPRGLAGEQIPLAARVFTVVDVWDALTSNRPYRPAWTGTETLEYILSRNGTQFQPEIVEFFQTMVQEGI